MIAGPIFHGIKDTHRPSRLWAWTGRTAFLLCLTFTLAACTSHKIHSVTQHNAISLVENDLAIAGVAFITPSTVTGQEQDKQALALIFSDVLKEKRPDIHTVSLPETLGSVNRAGLTDEYTNMFKDYRITGILNRDILQKIGSVTGSRYLVQLKLASFKQESQGRWGFFGYRIMVTKSARIRVFFQIWDSLDGSIAWEGSQELNYANDTTSEEPITFKTVVNKTANNLIARLP